MSGTPFDLTDANVVMALVIGNGPFFYYTAQLIAVQPHFITFDTNGGGKIYRGNKW